MVDVRSDYLENEIWKDIIFYEVAPIYMISNYGRLYNKERDRIVKGENPDFCQGRLRYSLKLRNGKHRKYLAHRIVAKHFKPARWVWQIQINHKDGNPLNNHISNLEWCTPDENNKHASINNLIPKGEEKINAIFTNEQIHNVCKLFEKGYNVMKVARKLKLDNHKNIANYLTLILYRKSWTTISKNYVWDIEKNRYKTYSKEDIEFICKMISDGYKNSEIVDMLPQYDKKKIKSVIKNIRGGHLYKKISTKYF